MEGESHAQAVQGAGGRAGWSLSHLSNDSAPSSAPRAVGTCQQGATDPSRALALRPQAEAGKQRLSPCIPTEPEGHRVTRSFPASSTLGSDQG